MYYALYCLFCIVLCYGHKVEQTTTTSAAAATTTITTTTITANLMNVDNTKVTYWEEILMAIPPGNILEIRFLSSLVVDA